MLWGCVFFVVDYFYIFFNVASTLHILAEGFSRKKFSGYSSDFHITLAFHVVPSGTFTN